MSRFKIIENIEQVNIGELKYMHTWTFNIPFVFKLAQRMKTARVSLWEAKRGCFEFGAVMCRTQPTIRSKKQLTDFLESRIALFKDWERRNGIAVYERCFERIVKGLETVGLKRDKAKKIAKEVLMSMQIRNFDLPKGKMTIDNLMECIVKAFFFNFSADVTSHSYRFLSRRKTRLSKLKRIRS